jgi:uncharacterized protein VirK/YbjX
LDREIFYKLFKQNQPQLFCLSAVSGLAVANGWNRVLAVRHDHQIAYEENLNIGFSNSYTTLWKQFSAREIDGRLFEMAAPLHVRPLSDVTRSHRARARARRELWNDIARSSGAALCGYRRSCVSNS